MYIYIYTHNIIYICASIFIYIYTYIAAPAPWWAPAAWWAPPPWWAPAPWCAPALWWAPAARGPWNLPPVGRAMLLSISFLVHASLSMLPCSGGTGSITNASMTASAVTCEALLRDSQAALCGINREFIRDFLLGIFIINMFRRFPAKMIIC